LSNAVRDRLSNAHWPHCVKGSNHLNHMDEMTGGEASGGEFNKEMSFTRFSGI